MWQDFKGFLIKQNAIALAIAVVLGVALNTLVQAIVNDFIMPIITVAQPAGNWKTAVWTLGPFKFGVGDFVSALVNFIIIGFVCWRISKIFVKEPAPAATTKKCPYCKTDVDKDATRCPACTSEIGAMAAA